MIPITINNDCCLTYLKLSLNLYSAQTKEAEYIITTPKIASVKTQITNVLSKVFLIF